MAKKSRTKSRPKTTPLVQASPLYKYVLMTAIIAIMIGVGYLVVKSSHAASQGITVSGDQFFLNGQPFTPHGFNAMGLLYSQWCTSDPRVVSAYQKFGTAELNTAKNVWYANTIRWQVSEPVLADPTEGPTYAKEIASHIAIVRQAGFVVDIAMQDQPAACGQGQPLPSAATETAWKTLISNSNLKSDPYVMFELYNEPQSKPVTTPSTQPTVWNWPDWQNGGRQISDPQSPASWSPYVPVGMQELVNYLRGPLGVSNLIIADGANWDETLESIQPLTDPGGNNQIAYSIHPYDYANPANYAARWGNLAMTHAVFATEWNCYYNAITTDPSQTGQTLAFLSYMLNTAHEGILYHSMDYGTLFYAKPRNLCGQLYLTDYASHFKPTPTPPPTPTPTPIPIPSHTPILTTPTPTPIPTPTKTPTPAAKGLSATFYQHQDFNTVQTSGKVVTETVADVNFNWCLIIWKFHYCRGPVKGIGSTAWSAKFQGFVVAPTTGAYTFTATTDDGTRLFINNVKLIDQWHNQAATSYSATIQLMAGQPVPLDMEYYQDEGLESARLQWSGPGIPTQVVPAKNLRPLPKATGLS